MGNIWSSWGQSGSGNGAKSTESQPTAAAITVPRDNESAAVLQPLSAQALPAPELKPTQQQSLANEGDKGEAPKTIGDNESGTEDEDALALMRRRERDLQRRWALLVEGTRMRNVTVEDARQLVSLTLWSGVAGMLLGGLKGSNQAGKAFMEENKNTRFVNKIHAQQQLNYASFRGFLRKGTSAGWRVALFVGTFRGTMMALEQTREKKDIVNVMAAGGATGALFGIPSGLRGIRNGVVLGLVFSTGLGAVFQGMWWVEAKARQEREARDKLARENTNQGSNQDSSQK